MNRFGSYLLGKAALEMRLKTGKEPSLKAFNPENYDSQVRIKTSSSSNPRVPNIGKKEFIPETQKCNF